MKTDQSHTEQVRDCLEVVEPVDQEEFIEVLNAGSDLDSSQILLALRELMENDEVSYTLDYQLQTEYARVTNKSM